jgi:sugar (pentulose or hexulose) kinase
LGGNTVVLDVGKTMSKASLWSPSGALLDRRTRANARPQTQGYRTLDVHGIDEWIGTTLRAFGQLAPIVAIVPVAHGAAAALLRDGRLACGPMDYEQPIPADLRRTYDSERDDFAVSGSPELPLGLNLGVQLHYLEALDPDVLRPGTTVVTWPQFWAWRLCGEAATEVSSLGCHTDLWCPQSGCPSALARRRGWSDRFAPLRGASECLGTLSPEWIERTRLSPTTRVYCGLHDSNAALLATQSFSEVAGRDVTVVSTGTWFVAMRKPAHDAPTVHLIEQRDCLLNVDVYGQPVPSARFMGGREIEILCGDTAARIDDPADQASILAALPSVVTEGYRIRPTWVSGCGPFPTATGRWSREPTDPMTRRAAVALYAALMIDTALDLIDSRDVLVVEGRFADSMAFVRLLATLRPEQRVYTAPSHDNIAFGALRLRHPELSPRSGLNRVEALAIDLNRWRAEWRAEAEE